MILHYIWEFIVDVVNIIDINIRDSRAWKLKERQRIRYYLSVDADELRCMPDIEVFATPYYRLTKKYGIDKLKTICELERFNSVQRVFWSVNAYEQKNYNGGILSFLTSDLAYTAAVLPSALEAVGAIEHSRLFGEFIRRNNIDLNDLTDFNTGSIRRKDKTRRLGELKRKYDTAEFDAEYRKLKPLEEYLVTYIRENADQLLAEVV